MKVVPAIDIQQGQVVRAVAGERLAYLPLQSVLDPSSDPGAIGRALCEQYNLTTAYLADLDAIAGAEPQWDLYRNLLDCGLSLWIDAGIATSERCEAMMRFGDSHAAVTGIIAGMESIGDRRLLQEFQQIVHSDLLIFSLDLKDGRPLTQEPSWKRQIALEIASEVARNGLRRMIVIDLARVGMHGGSGTKKLCTTLHEEFPDLALYAGGGVRHVDDLRTLAGWGCSAALVSSAIHDGWLEQKDLKSIRENETGG